MSQFSVVFNALDNIEARRHVNRVCIAAGRPLVDGGTSGYDGQVTTIIKVVPLLNACLTQSPQGTARGQSARDPADGACDTCQQRQLPVACRACGGAQRGWRLARTRRRRAIQPSARTSRRRSSRRSADHPPASARAALTWGLAWQGETGCYDCEPKPAPKGFPVCTIRASRLPTHPSDHDQPHHQTSNTYTHHKPHHKPYHQYPTTKKRSTNPVRSPASRVCVHGVHVQGCRHKGARQCQPCVAWPALVSRTWSWVAEDVFVWRTLVSGSRKRQWVGAAR